MGDVGFTLKCKGNSGGFSVDVVFYIYLETNIWGKFIICNKPGTYLVLQ